MIAMQVKRSFQGKFVVLVGAEGEEEQVFGPASKAECDAYVGGKSPPASAPPTAKGDPEDSPTPVDEREYHRRLDRDLRKPVDEQLAEIRAILANRHDEDAVEYMMRQIGPIIAAGKEGGRRERARYIRPVPARAA